MPVFYKSDYRIYFAHIPKSAGTYVYSLFLDQGYRMSRCDLGSDKAALDLTTRYAHLIDKSVTPRSSHQSVQHALFDDWRKWGPFDASFAVMRDPSDRFLSAIKHRYGFSNLSQTAAEFKANSIRKIRRTLWRKPRLWDGHLLPQVRFLGPTTKVFWFGSDFASEICREFGLENNKRSAANVSLKLQLTLSKEELRWVQSKYKKDYEYIKELGFNLGP